MSNARPWWSYRGYRRNHSRALGLSWAAYQRTFPNPWQIPARRVRRWRKKATSHAA